METVQRYIAVCVKDASKIEPDAAGTEYQVFATKGEAVQWLRSLLSAVSEWGITYIIRVIDGYFAGTALNSAGYQVRMAFADQFAMMPFLPSIMDVAGLPHVEDVISAKAHSEDEATAFRVNARASDVATVFHLQAKRHALESGTDLNSPAPPPGVPVAWSTKGPVAKHEVTLTEATDAVEKYLNLMGFDLAHKYATGLNVVVGMIDTGCRQNVKELAGRVIARIDTTGQSRDATDGDGHGTFTASQLCGITGSGGLLGGAPDCRLVIIKSLTDQGWGTDTMIANGIRAGIKAGCNVLSMSIGGDGAMPDTEAAVAEAENAGVTIVAACGNAGRNTGRVSYPARYPSCIAVGALDPDGTVASYSQSSSDTDVYAYGSRQYGIGTSGKVEAWDGTSMATPHISAACALAVQAMRKAGALPVDPESVRDAVLIGSTGQPSGRFQGDNALTVAIGVSLKELFDSPITPPSPPPVPNPNPGAFYFPKDASRTVFAAQLVGIMGAVAGVLDAGRGCTVTVVPDPEHQTEPTRFHTAAAEVPGGDGRDGSRHGYGVVLPDGTAA